MRDPWTMNGLANSTGMVELASSDYTIAVLLHSPMWDADAEINYWQILLSSRSSETSNWHWIDFHWSENPNKKRQQCKTYITVKLSAVWLLCTFSLLCWGYLSQMILMPVLRCSFSGISCFPLCSGKPDPVKEAALGLSCLSIPMKRKTSLKSFWNVGTLPWFLILLNFNVKYLMTQTVAKTCF